MVLFPSLLISVCTHDIIILDYLIVQSFDFKFLIVNEIVLMNMTWACQSARDIPFTHDKQG